MENAISLTKIGNLKIGKVRNGTPIATERILVTLPTKNNEENFTIFPGFKEEGEEKVNITLPFDNNELNFEVNYVGFSTIGEVDYIIKVKDFGEDILMYPLSNESGEEKVINLGEFTEELQEKLGLERTGFLKAYVEGVSGLGEVFYFKTKSANTIKVIQDQLKILSSLTGGKIAGIPLVMKPMKKDTGDNSIIYISISFRETRGAFSALEETLAKRNNLHFVDINAFETLYKESRELSGEDIVAFEDLEGVELKMETNTEVEIAEIENKAKETKSEEEEFVSAFFKEKEIEIPIVQGVAVLNKLNGDVDKFEEFFSEKKTLADVLKFIAKKDN